MLYTCEGTPRRGIGILQSLHLFKILSLCEFSRFCRSAAELSAILGHDSASQGIFFSETSRTDYPMTRPGTPEGGRPPSFLAPVCTSDGSYHEPLDLVQNNSFVTGCATSSLSRTTVAQGIYSLRLRYNPRAHETSSRQTTALLLSPLLAPEHRCWL